MRQYALATLAGLVIGGGIFVVVAQGRSPLPTVHAVTEDMLLAADAAGGWLTHGRDFTNQRYAPFTQINRDNVKRLERIWHQGPRRLIKSFLRTESTPIVVDNLLIYTDPGMRLSQPGNHVIAVDVASGREVWSWSRSPDPPRCAAVW
jgi:quinohemoprotein ethanol dehydrogenase